MARADSESRVQLAPTTQHGMLTTHLGTTTWSAKATS